MSCLLTSVNVSKIIKTDNIHNREDENKANVPPSYNVSYVNESLA